MKTNQHNTRLRRRLEVAWQDVRWTLPVVRIRPARLPRNDRRHPSNPLPGWQASAQTCWPMNRRSDREPSSGSGLCGCGFCRYDSLGTGLGVKRNFWLQFKQDTHCFRPRDRWAFTLIELLVVIGIIGVLAGILLPVLAMAKTKAKEKMARVEIQTLVGAMAGYEAQYSRFPAAQSTEQAAGTLDVTFGEVDNQYPGLVHLRPSHAEVMQILLDLNLGANQNHQRNPRKIKLFDPQKESGDDNSPGLGTDQVLRDPFGNPYIISVDMNADGDCSDAQYGTITNKSVVVWSFGRDRKNDGVLDKNNILSWK